MRILRLKAFGLSSAIAAMAGALFAHYLTNVTSEAFGISFAIQFIAMIIIGGMGSLAGSLVGAALWLLLPSVISGFASQASGSTGIVRLLLVENRAQLVQLIFGMLVISLSSDRRQYLDYIEQFLLLLKQNFNNFDPI